VILKIVLSTPNKQVFCGSIAKWYKAEGDWVSYGEVILDLKINQLSFTKKRALKTPIEILSHLSSSNSLNTIEASIQYQNNIDFLLRIVSADVGFLRQICAKESEYRELGAVLAVLTTEANEPLDLSPLDWSQASAFRSVSNIVLNDIDSDIEEIESEVASSGSRLGEIQAELERSRLRLAEIQASLNGFKSDAKLR
jgi:hypothetical protein